MKTLFASISLLICSTAMAVAQLGNGPVGFVNYSDLGNDGITGGGTGPVVRVSTRADFERYVQGPAPYVIILDADITGGGMEDLNDPISVGSNKTIIGAGAGKALNGICIDMKNQSNVIFRNITLTKGREDGIAMRGCHHIWIDHCDLSNSYDGLLDFTLGSDYMTCSWTKLHDHDKVSIVNSGTCHFEDYGREHVTYAHCWFANNVQRNPRIGYGRAHVYNCYWTDISSYCIGFHSQAQVLSENNYFTASANHPFNNQYSDVLPYCGYLTDRNSYFAKGNPGNNYSQRFTDISYSPLTYYNYSFDLNETEDVPATTPDGVGPKDGIEYEPILNPGNGAIDVPVTRHLTWGSIEGVTNSRVLIGTERDNLVETAAEDIVLQPLTTYYWQVIVTVDGTEHSSPISQFTTAAEVPTKPYPADGDTSPWLRWPSSSSAFCTNMQLSWCPAFDASSYKVYVGESTDALILIDQTSALTSTKYDFLLGKTYYWRVDAVKADDTEQTGDVWSFSTPTKTLLPGKNEAELMYRSGIAFFENLGGASSYAATVGDQGPGALIGIWDGEEGTYAISTTSYDQTLGPNLIGVTVGDKLIDAWLTSDQEYKFSTRQTRHTVYLRKGDPIRIDFVAGYVNGSLNESRAHIDYITFTATDADIVETSRPSGQYHSPISTPGYDCEYLPVASVLFTDSLGTVGDYGSTQVKDMYCSWISRSVEAMTYYLKECAMARLEYKSATGALSLVTHMLDFNQTFALDAPLTDGNSTLNAVRLYKSAPADTIYYKPVATEGYEWQLLLSPDCIFLDTEGVKGNKNKVQIRDGYDQWMKYYNPSANEVQAKNAASGIRAFIDPVTDTWVYPFVPTGSDGSSYSYVVGTEKNMTYFLQACKRVKFYYSGTGGAATNLTVTVTDVETGEAVTVVGPDAKGKNVASNMVEAEVNPNHLSTVKIIATTGDMLIYALKMWPSDEEGISIVRPDTHSNSPSYNLWGQRVNSDHSGMVIQDGSIKFK
ncbi:MAG: hypothetical protein J5543_05380 [Bacteroidales bacterium]|nr:hypothetical protein [Bacteroidales bacterium]